MNLIETTQNHAGGEPFSGGTDAPAQSALGEPSSAVGLESEIQPSRRSWKSVGIGVGVLLATGAVGVLIWRFFSYAPFVLPSAIALGHIFLKDWHNYKPSWKRWPIVAIVVAAGVGGVAYQSHQLQEKVAAEARNRANTEYLQGKVEATLAAQKNNAETFMKSLNSLSGEFKTPSSPQ